MELIIVFILGMVGAVLVQLSANRGVSRWRDPRNFCVIDKP